jgi:Na+/proline symporter
LDGLRKLWTCKGGMKAVVWLDFLQSLILITMAILVLAYTLNYNSGAKIFDELKKNNKIVPIEFFNFTPRRFIDFW